MPKIDADLVVLPDGTEHLIFWEIPLEWFGDERGGAAMALAEARARAKHKGHKAEH